MTEEQYEEFDSVFAEVCILMHKEPTELLSKSYFKFLMKYSLEELKACFQYIVNNDKFFPTISRINEALEGKTEDKAIFAYQQAYGAVARYGKYHSVMFGDPVITSTIKNMGGWLKFCDLEFNEWTRKEFERIYKSFSNVQCGHETLHGLLAIDNNSKGFAYSDVKSIGQVNKTQKIGISDSDRRMSKSALEFMEVKK